MQTTIYSREFAMPNAATFSLRPVSRLLDRWLVDATVIVDPFARDSKRATITNDLNPDTNAEYHMLAEEFVAQMSNISADAVLFDPPYSPRQITEVYQHIGQRCGKQETQNGRLYRRVKDGLHTILKPGGIAICCGWNSIGFGLTRGYDLIELLLVTHGSAHNDTIITVERKRPFPDWAIPNEVAFAT
jgi:hypothetical protein